MIRLNAKLSWRHLALLTTLATSACAGTFPYSVPVQQGNVITVEMLQELKLGMDKRKVKFILGTPLVVDAFHQNRWDYYYSYNPGGGDTVQQKASLFFDEDRLVRIDADVQSNVNFHTVTHATDKVLVVPPKKNTGFLAAITPGFILRDDEQKAQEQIQKTLDSGFNQPQPGSAQPGATASANAALDPALEPSAAGAAVLPSEIYAPNSALGVESGKPPPPAAATETVSAETRDQSQYLESLFDSFAAAAAAPPQPDEASGVISEPGPGARAADSRDPTAPTRD